MNNDKTELEVEQDALPNGESLALDDDRRVKTLSPGRLVMRRYTRNRLAIVGTVIIAAMFLFSFVGGLVTPYGQAETFTLNVPVVRDWAFATTHVEPELYISPDAEGISPVVNALLLSAVREGKTEVSTDSADFEITQHNGYLWTITGKAKVSSGRAVGSIVAWDVLDDDGLIAALDAALADGQTWLTYNGDVYEITVNGKAYSVRVSLGIAAATTLTAAPLSSEFTGLTYGQVVELASAVPEYSDGSGNAVRQVNGEFVATQNGEDWCVLSSDLSIQPRQGGEIIPLELRALIRGAIDSGDSEFSYGGVDYTLAELNGQYSIKTEQETQVVSLFERPSARHLLGTDGAGMDVMTRLMYGGRVSLIIGFVVIVISCVLGITLGGISGYFGKWVDAVIMRAVDIFACIPSIPLYLILGAVMEGNNVDTSVRIYVLMAVMGLLSWSGVARIVRGQILSLREQDFMRAAEALGIKVRRRIFRHLIPNVIPLMIVWATMGLGEVILSESTLSFLGLGVKYPLASWGNILNSVSDMHIMTSYIFAWLPAGFCILVTVLGFNFIGDGLRDAFDPKTKR